MKTLPKYFIILRDDTNPLWEKYIQWLIITYKSPWSGSFDNYFYGYDGNTNDGYHGVDCHSNPQRFINNPTIITLDYWNESVNGFRVPETWHVVVTKENVGILSKWRGVDLHIGQITGMAQSTWSPIPTKEHNPRNSTQGFGNEITYEQFKQYILKQTTMEKKVIGYKLIKPEMLQTASVIIYGNTAGSSQLRDMLTEESYIEKFRNAGVLNIWFEPVYEDLLESKVKEFTAKTGIEVGSTIVAPNTISGEICWDSSHVKWRTTTAHGNREVTKFILHSDGTTLLMQVSGTTSDVWFDAYKMKLTISGPSITIKGYKAEFTEDSVTFGCQTYSKEFVMQLAKCLETNGFDMSAKREIIEIAKYFNS